MIAWRCSTVTAVVLTSVAGAQPVDPDPPVDPEAPLESVPELAPDPRSGGYPRGLVDRPLVLSGGTVEGTLLATFGRYDGGAAKPTNTSIAPIVRYAFGPVELEGGLRVLLHSTGMPSFVEEERLYLPFVAARYAMTPDMTVGLHLGELLPYGPAKELSSVTPRLLLGRKQLVLEQLAVESQFALGLNHTRGVEPLGSPDGATTIVTYVATGQVRVQWQLAPHYAAEARVALNVAYEESVGTGLSHDYGVALVSSVLPTLDVTPGVDLFVTQDDYVGVVFSVAVSARNR